MIKKYVCAFFIFIAVVMLPIKFVHAQEITCVSIISLIATPEKYDGKHVRIIGFTKLEFEGTSIYISKEDSDKWLSKNGLWLEVGSDLWDKYNNKFCLVEGIFDAQDTGHRGLWSGAIKEISRIEVWKTDQ